MSVADLGWPSRPADSVRGLVVLPDAEAQVAEALGVAGAMNGGPGTFHAPRAFEPVQGFSET